MSAGDPHYLLYAIQHAIPLFWHYIIVMVLVGGTTELTRRWAGE